MKKGTLIALVLAAGVGSYVLGGMARKSRDSGPDVAGPGKADDAKGAAPVDPGVERYRVPLEGTGRGAPDALVNIVAFSDFQCPFGSRVTPPHDKILKDYD